MLSRALILAAVTFVLGCCGVIPSRAQNLEAGKPPSQIFSSTCSLCHKSARGLLKGVSPGSLPGFLRQHYTTSSDMASAMSAYVLSNGAANAPVGGGNLTKQGQEAKSGAKPPPPAAADSGPERAAKGRKPTREASRPDVDGLQDVPGAPPLATGEEQEQPTARQKAAQERAERAAKRRAAKGVPPKIDARHELSPKEGTSSAEPAKTESAKTESAKTEDVKDDAAKSDTTKSETAKVDGTRVDPVPAVTPAPPVIEKGPDTAAIAPPKPVVDDPNRPLTIDLGPAPAPPAAVAVSGPPAVPAGKPIPPISR